MNDAARWPVLHDASARGGKSLTDDLHSRVSAWRAEPEALALLTQGAELSLLVGDAASWAEQITLCLTAPQSERGTLPWWRELLARSSKCAGTYVRQAQRSEPWLIHRLHALGALRLVEGGGKQVASNLLIFSRGDELRVVLTHIPLERAVAGAAFGALLTFRGGKGAELARACGAQLESWAELARIPTGSEIDALMLDARRRGPLPAPEPPRSRHVVVDAEALSSGLERFGVAAGAASGGGSSSGADTALDVRSSQGSHRVSLRSDGDTPFVLTFHGGAAWAAGNALLLDEGHGESLLVWRGGLLGSSRSRGDLLWSEARFATFRLEDAALGLSQRVAVVAHSGAPLEPQLAAFARELGRLSDVFGVQPPPALGHVLADFSTLSARQQTLLAARALLGAGALDLATATRVAAEALRDQGYLRGQSIAPGSDAHEAIAELLANAADAGAGFDRPSPDTLRAIQPERSAYVLDDWLECLLRALPDNAVVDQRSALRLGFERAREFWGLRGERLRPGSSVERALEAAVSTALCRGSLVRVGSGGLQRLGRESPYPELPRAVANACPHGFVGGFAQRLEALEPVSRFLLARRSGWYGRREALSQVAQRLGLTLERARQIESDAWAKLAAGSGWARELRSRLERAFAGARVVRVRELARDDAWWQGVEQHLELADAVFEALFNEPLHRVELGGPAREAFFARFDAAALEQAFGALLAQAAQVATPADIDVYQRLCDAASAELDRGLAEDLREALEAHLELDPDEPSRVLSFVASDGAALEPFPVDPKGVDSEALLRLRDVLRSVFRSAGTPLSLAAVGERLQKRLDVDDATLTEQLSHPPFVRRNPDQYGLVSRDVPGGPEAIAAVLNDVTEALRASQRALGPDPLWAIVQARMQQAWSPELVRSLIGGDPALSLGSTNDTTLRRWEHARLLPHGPLLCPGVPAVVRPRFDKLAQQPPCSREVLAERLSSELRRLERAGDADDLRGLPLARQLGDLSERLLEHTDDEPTDTRALARAAVQILLDALEPDEDDLDAPLIDHDRLTEARAVFAAVLRWLGLSWL